MAAGAAHFVSVGWGITFGTCGFAAGLLDVNPASASSETVDVTPQSTTTPLPGTIGNTVKIGTGIVDPGQLTFTCLLHSAQSGATQYPPITGIAETITVTAPKAGSNDIAGATYVGSGYVTGANITGSFADRVTMDVTVDWLGGVAVTAATTS